MSIGPKPNRLLSRREFLVGTGLGLASIASVARAQTLKLAEPGPPDLVVTNALVITQDPQRPRATAIAARGGIITAVGDTNEINGLAGRGTLVVDAGGRTVIPGLNDSHQHPTRTGRSYAAELRWDGVSSLRQGLELIRAAASRTPEGQWVRVVGGWSPFQFEERRLPSPAELTAAAPDTPVFVLFLYARGYLNRKAVEASGLARAAQAPPGARYEFTPDGGCIFHADPNPELLYAQIAALPPLTAEHQALSVRHYYRELNRFGLTSVIDAGGGGHAFPQDYSATDALARSGDLPIRISNYLFPQERGKELAQFEAWTRDYEVGHNEATGLPHGYETEGAGEFLVWSAGDFENFMAERPDLGARGSWDKELLSVTRHLLRNRWPLRIHATYDESVSGILDVFEQAHALEVSAGRDGLNGVRWAIDHGETLKLPTLHRIKAMGGGVAVQARMAYAGEYFLERYGREATRNAPPLRDIVEAGIPLGLGTDGTRIASYNPWPAIYWATTGKSLGGTELHGERHRLTREEALFHFTVGSAWFSQEENLKGRIAPGQYADLSLLNAPYLDVAETDLLSIEADATFVGGKAVFGVGEFSGLAEALSPIEPSWSPVRSFGGYRRRAAVSFKPD